MNAQDYDGDTHLTKIDNSQTRDSFKLLLIFPPVSDEQQQMT
jgi:hypothetical protein